MIKDKVEEVKEKKAKQERHIDTVPADNLPTISISSPAEGAIVSGTVNVPITASDNEGVSKVEFYIDGTIKSTDTTSPYSYSWDTTQYSNGAHTIKAIVYDTVNQTVSTQSSVTVNNVSGDEVPTIMLTAPAAGTTVSGAVSVTADASDDQGIAKVDFYIDGIFKETDTTAPYGYQWNTKQYNNGSHTIAAMAIDTASQATNIQYSVIVDNILGVWQTQIIDSTGDTGWYTAITVDSNNYPHISYQDYTNRDLKYARWTGSAWNIETVDSAGDVGSFTSIAVDSNNYPRISYYDETNKDLKYAKWTGSGWSIDTVDSIGDVGWESSLTLDVNYYPHIAYYDYTNQNLKYTKWTGSAWSIETVDSSGDVGRHSFIVLDTNNYPHIIYQAYTNKDLKYAKWTGSDWSIDTVDSTVFVGEDALMRLDANNYPRIYYYNTTRTILKCKKWTGTAWSEETVEQANDTGLYSSIDLDTSQYLHVAYFNSNYNLKYARWTGLLWSIETLDLIDFGAYVSMELDPNNHPHIAYYDGISKDLKYATK